MTLPEPSFTPYLVSIIGAVVFIVIFFLLPPDKPNHHDCGKK